MKQNKVRFFATKVDGNVFASQSKMIPGYDMDGNKTLFTEGGEKIKRITADPICSQVPDDKLYKVKIEVSEVEEFFSEKDAVAHVMEPAKALPDPFLDGGDIFDATTTPTAVPTVATPAPAEFTIEPAVMRAKTLKPATGTGKNESLPRTGFTAMQDQFIIDNRQANNRIPLRQIAQSIGKTYSAVSNRISVLKTRGLIPTKYK